MAAKTTKTPKVRARLSKGKLTKAFIKSPTLKNRATVAVPSGQRNLPQRRQIIENYFGTLQQKYYCPALKDYVGIYKTSRKESIYRGSASQQSTIATLNLEYVIKNSVRLSSTNAKSNNSQRNFLKMFVLGCTIKGVGVVKTTVGKFKPHIHNATDYALYCITAVKITRLKPVKR